MTVETTTRKQNFDGGQAELEFTFRALPEAPEDIKCIATSDAGAITDLEYDVDYTVAVNSDGIGGTVTLNPTFATTYTHTVYRETTIKQESDYDDYNPFPADTLETNIDRLTMIAQEERELGERTLKYPISSTGTDTNLPVPEAGKFIAWNAAGDGMENKDIPDPSTLIKASQAEAEAGTDNDNFMTPLRTKQAIDELVVQSDDIPLSYLSTSGTLSENSDTKVASQKATKTYADTKIPKTDIDTTITLGTSDTKVPSQKAVKTYVDASPSIPVPSMQVFTSSGTWTKPTGVTKIMVEVVGGGGGAWGKNDQNPSAGGGGGGYCKKIIDVTSIASVSVTVGAGGFGRTSDYTNPTNGGNSSFGSHCYGNGGGAAEQYKGGVGGTATGGDANIAGQGGGVFTVGFGGNSVLGHGGKVNGGSSGSFAGSAGSLYGGGGGGGWNDGVGGNGAAGVVIVYY